MFFLPPKRTFEVIYHKGFLYIHIVREFLSIKRYFLNQKNKKLKRSFTVHITYYTLLGRYAKYKYYITIYRENMLGKFG